jgi:hypothetical protein
MRYGRSMREHGRPMSATPASCASCGADLPVGARFCASCGARTGPVGSPVTWAVAERRYFGLVPGATVFNAARGRLGRWVAVARSRIGLAYIVAAARLIEAVAWLQVRLEAARLGRARSRLLRALGDAAYRDARKDVRHIRTQIGELERRMEAVNEGLEQIRRREHERIAQARMEGGPTNIVEPEPPPSQPPGPLVPEPEPIPHDPPGPVIVPEPEPVPHEPPGPVIVPEPEPPTGD